MRNGHKHKKRRLSLSLLLIVILAGYSYWSLTRPLPPLKPQLANTALSAKTPPGNLSWPSPNQAAVGIVGTNIIETHGEQKPLPIASTAKVITALMVLKEKPLQLGQQGPVYTITGQDIESYRKYIAQGGSVLPIQAGQQISQYQMLQALLLPSANNIADGLAIWTYGSLAAYSQAANAYLKEKGLNNTRVGSDASGLAPDTTSNAADLVKLGKLAMQNPVIAQVVGQSTAEGFPIANTIRNVNTLLGTDNIIGIKTGTTDQAGGAFIGAANVIVNGKPEIIITAVVNAPNRALALQQSQALIKSAQTNFKPVTVTKKNVVLGNYQVPWGGTVPAVASKDLSLSTWQGTPLKANINLHKTDATPTAGETVGQLKTKTSLLADQKTIPVKLQTTPPEPSLWWRLTHP